jgi:cystathionine beta-lyase
MAPSKTFNIPGLHSSFAIIQNAGLREQLCSNRRGIIGEPNILAQTATKAAFKHGKAWLIELIDYLDKNRKYAINFLNDFMPGIKVHSPEGTYLLWLDCRGLNLGEDPFDFFLKNAKVGLNKGESFGKNGKEFVRLNFACSRGLLNKALDRMARSLAQKPK